MAKKTKPARPQLPKSRWHVTNNFVIGKGSYVVEVALARHGYSGCFEVTLHRNGTAHDILNKALTCLAQRCLETGQPLQLANETGEFISIHPTQDRLGGMCVGLRIVGLAQYVKSEPTPAEQPPSKSQRDARP